jgi:hypothetical protein
VSPTPNGPGRPSHPTAKAAALFIGVVLLLIALAMISTFGGL